MREQIIFKTMTKNWQAVNRRNFSGQTVPKSWSGHRKRPCTNSRATNWRDEKMVGWWRTEWWSTRHVGQPSERSEVFWGVAVKKPVGKKRGETCWSTRGAHYDIKWSLICSNFFRHYKSPFHIVIRIHLISLSHHILVFCHLILVLWSKC